MTVTLGIALVGLLTMLVGYMRLQPFRSRAAHAGYRTLPAAFWMMLLLVLLVGLAMRGSDVRIVFGGVFWALVLVGWAWERQA